MLKIRTQDIKTKCGEKSVVSKDNGHQTMLSKLTRCVSSHMKFRTPQCLKTKDGAKSDVLKDNNAPHFEPMITKLTGYVSNHVRVNRCRTMHGLTTLRRSKALDYMASLHAVKMSTCMKIFPLLSSIEGCANLFTQNVHRGYTLQYIQDAIEDDDDWSTSRETILSNDIHEIGVGSSVGPDGLIYLCQLFR
jgi:hypothetical protein